MAATPAGATLTAASAPTARDVRASSEVRQGVLAMAPMIVGYAPYAVVVGSVIAAHGSPAAGWAGIWLIFAGSAHLATIKGVEAGSLALAILTGLVVNARLLVYSASMAEHWRGQPRWFRLAAGAALVDPTWFVADRRAREPGTLQEARQFFFGAAGTLAIAWGVLVTTGMLLGAGMGAALGLELAVPLCLLSMIGPRVLKNGSRAVVVTAGLTALLAGSMPASTGLLAAIVAGAVVGALVRERRP
jgi:predicted branched-subunit amino acid permease